MPDTVHTYTARVAWTGNRGVGTTNRRAYSRDTETSFGARPLLAGSSDPAFRGDAARWNPEDLLLTSLSQCHLLWYLDLAARAGVVVVAYVDDPVATMTGRHCSADDLSGRFGFAIRSSGTNRQRGPGRRIDARWPGGSGARSNRVRPRSARTSRRVIRAGPGFTSARSYTTAVSPQMSSR